MSKILENDKKCCGLVKFCQFVKKVELSCRDMLKNVVSSFVEVADEGVVGDLE